MVAETPEGVAMATQNTVTLDYSRRPSAFAALARSLAATSALNALPPRTIFKFKIHSDRIES